MNCQSVYAMASTIAIAGVLACLGLQSAEARPPLIPDNGNVTLQAPKAPESAAISRDPAVLALPSDAAALGGYNVLIADRGNNRLLLVSPEKQTLWSYQFEGLPAGSGADDAFFADDGKSVIVNLEHQQVIQIIDFASKTVIWQYGKLGVRGSAPACSTFPTMPTSSPTAISSWPTSATAASWRFPWTRRSSGRPV